MTDNEAKHAANKGLLVSTPAGSGWILEHRNGVATVQLNGKGGLCVPCLLDAIDFVYLTWGFDD